MVSVEIKTVKLSAIKLNPDNPRRISTVDMDRLVKSLTEFPDMMSIREIVVDETMTVLGGNMRTLALRKIGAVPIPGFQLRYIYFLDPTAKDRLTVPILPFSEIERRGAGMYKGIKRPKQAMTGDQPEQREGSTHPDAPNMTDAFHGIEIKKL